MLDLAGLSAAFRPAEIETLAQSYRYAVSYFDCGPPLEWADKHFLARLTIMAAATRCRQEKSITSIVDAHAIAAEVMDFYDALRKVGTHQVW